MQRQIKVLTIFLGISLAKIFHQNIFVSQIHLGRVSERKFDFHQIGFLRLKIVSLLYELLEVSEAFNQHT